MQVGDNWKLIIDFRSYRDAWTDRNSDTTAEEYPDAYVQYGNTQLHPVGTSHTVGGHVGPDPQQILQELAGQEPKKLCAIVQ